MQQQQPAVVCESCTVSATAVGSWELRASCGHVMSKEVLYSDGATMYF